MSRARKPSRLHGAPLRGKRYEARVGAYLSKASVGAYLRLFAAQWIHFIDANGAGYAQPDYFFVSQERVLCLECKLTQTSAAWDQLRLLYAPLLQKLFSRRVDCVQVCKNLVINERVVYSIKEAKDGDTWHWGF